MCKSLQAKTYGTKSHKNNDESALNPRFFERKRVQLGFPCSLIWTSIVAINKSNLGPNRDSMEIVNLHIRSMQFSLWLGAIYKPCGHFFVKQRNYIKHKSIDSSYGHLKLPPKNPRRLKKSLPGSPLQSPLKNLNKFLNSDTEAVENSNQAWVQPLKQIQDELKPNMCLIIINL